MKNGRWLALALLAGCTAPDDSSPSGTPPGEVGTTTGSGSPTDGTVTGGCAPTAHAQVFQCTADVSVPGELVFEWEGPDGLVRSVTSPSGSSHEATIFGLKPDSSYTVRFLRGTASASVEIQSGSIPVELEGLGSTTGVGSFEQLLVPLHCDGTPRVAMIDREGEVVWWNGYPPAFDGLSITGFHRTGTGTIATHVGSQYLFEHALDGTELRRIDRFDGFDQPIHHDIFGTADGRLYTLFAEEVFPPEGNRALDGVYVFDASGQLEATWHLFDHITTDPAFVGGNTWQGVWPGADDYAHANGIFIEPDGEMLLSLRWMDEVMKVRIDPDAPDFGEVLWKLVGTTGMVPEVSDFALSADPAITDYPSFRGQHSATWTDEGLLTLFDNREDVPGTSRGLVLDLDEGAGTAEIVEAYDLGVDCPVQGGAYGLPNGHRVFTCGTAAHKRIYEFERGNPDPVWTFQVECAGWYGLLNRAIPVWAGR